MDASLGRQRTMTKPMSSAGHPLTESLADWLQAHTEALDIDQEHASAVLPRLADGGLFRIGVPQELGGSGGSICDAIAAVAAVAEHSLTAAFVFWGHRTFIEYLLQSPNQQLAERLLPDLLAGRLAGATGLSNAMKYLCGIESLQSTVTEADGAYILDGKLPWVTNLRREGFVAALAADNATTGVPGIFAVPHDISGLARSDDLDLIALRGSNTAAVDLRGIRLDADWQIHPEANVFLPKVRPAFLGLQCGLALGVARASLDTTRAVQEATRSILKYEIEQATSALHSQWQLLEKGIETEAFIANPGQLFQIRINLAGIASAAVELELQSRGGKAYLRNHTEGFNRRWREAAFLPIVTPSLVQLKAQLAQQRQNAA
jgi:alkylation response protein AidB-like acyl-CoA dehydrogenase